MENKMIKLSNYIVTCTHTLKRYVVNRLMRNGITEIQESALDYMCDEINEYIDNRLRGSEL